MRRSPPASSPPAPIDTATESLAYYPVQVEKFLARCEALVAARGDDAIESVWSADEREVAEEFLAHARASRTERAAARRERRPARVLELLQSWGGVTVAYRRRLIDSPSYTLNHEEVDKALEEGIRFAEGLTPLAVDIDEYGRARSLKVSAQHNDGNDVWHEVNRLELPARTILIAAGTHPNTVLSREDPEHFHLDGKYFQTVDEAGNVVKPEKGLAKPWTPYVLTPTIVEVVVRAPAAARRFAPGQFYRLQNFETFAARVDGTRLTMEGLALTGAWVDRKQGLVSTIVLEMGGSSDLCAQLKPGEPVVLMGSTGSPMRPGAWASSRSRSTPPTASSRSDPTA